MKIGIPWTDASKKPTSPEIFLCIVKAEYGNEYMVLHYSHYEYVNEYVENPDLQEGEYWNEDDGTVSGVGWHRDVDGHGGEYDRYTEIFYPGSSNGEVLEYQSIIGPEIKQH